MTCPNRMLKFRANGNGKLSGQLDNPGYVGKMATKCCVCVWMYVLCIHMT